MCWLSFIFGWFGGQREVFIWSSCRQNCTAMHISKAKLEVWFREITLKVYVCVYANRLQARSALREWCIMEMTFSNNFLDRSCIYLKLFVKLVVLSVFQEKKQAVPFFFFSYELCFLSYSTFPCIGLNLKIKKLLQVKQL